MTQRPSASNNDPGYFYSGRKLLRLFTFSAAAMMAGILAMIWVDYDRPWKDEQRAQTRWEASRLELERWLLETQAQDVRKAIEKERARAQADIDARKGRIAELEKEEARLVGAVQGTTMAYNESKQFTGQAVYQVDEARSGSEEERWKREQKLTRDDEHRKRDAAKFADDQLAATRAELKKQRAELDAVVEKERASPELKRLQLLEAGVRKKRDYSPLREIPLLDFLAPPTHVEQVVLENLVDNYEFSTPRKVDRCGTCHIGVMRGGFEDYQWPVEILDLPAGSPEKVRKFEEAAYRFVFRMIQSVTGPASAKDDPYAYEKGLLQNVEIHNAALGLMFAQYDESDGTIGVDAKTGRKVWKRWRYEEEKGRWVAGKTGTSVDEYFLDLLQRMRGHWRTHPHFGDIVGDASPHPYERVGCTICHQGRGWSVDFGLAYHTPDRVRVEDWMTTERAHEEGFHDPLNVEAPLEEAMQKGASGRPTTVGWVTDHATGHGWEEELGWTHDKRHYWHWPQLPKALVQSSCLKCHKEGYLKPAQREYEGVRLGKPDPAVPDLGAYELHAAAFNDPDAEENRERILLPEEDARYRPRTLERGLDHFVSFGCYGCHKVDPVAYPLMERVRPKVGPPLDDITRKADRAFLQKWVRNPKDYREETKMPRFWGLSNNSHDFRYRFADAGWEAVDGDAWSNAEIYAVVEYLVARSEARDEGALPDAPWQGGDAARGERLLVGYDGDPEDDTGTSENAKACIACHDVPIRTPALQVRAEELASWTDRRTRTTLGWKERMARRHGPDLAGIGSKVKPQWLFLWLKDPQGRWHDTSMPDLRLTDREAKDVVAYLMTLRNEAFDALPGVDVDHAILQRMAEELKVSELASTVDGLNAAKAMSADERVQYVGSRLVKHYGCFGCHQIEEFKDTTPIGTELTEWGSKLIERLAYNHAPVEKTHFDFAYTKLMNPRIFDRGMTARDLPYERLRMPRFGFSPEEAMEISTFLVGLVNDIIPKAAAYQPDRRRQDILRGREIVRRYNCQGCHVIEGEGGDVWPAISRKKEKWRPPDLLGQGIKTDPQWLFAFLKDPAFVTIPGQEGTDRVRPWHSIRMPTFPLTDEEARALVKYFAALSETSADFESVPVDSLVGPGAAYESAKAFEVKDPADPTRKVRAGARNRLEEAEVLFRQYECKSCHSSDPKVPIGNRAPNFRHSRAGRLRESWIRTWLWGPSKLQPGTAMPTFFAGPEGPVAQDRQFFGGDPEAQIRALRDFIRHHYREED